MELKKIENSEQKKLAIERLNKLLNSAPKKIKQDKKGIKYVPIVEVEMLLKAIFQLYKIELIDYKVIANAVSVHVRVHYLHPITNEWLYHDGVGAKAIQLEAGSTPTDFTKIKSNAIEICLPAAKSQAIKNACKHLGKKFGLGLNTDDEADMVEVYKNNINKVWEGEE